MLTVLFLGYFLFYVGMAILQVVAAMMRLFHVERRDSTYAIGLKKYLSVVSVYFIFLFIAMETNWFHDFIFIYLFIIPWFISLRYYLFVRSWDKKLKNIHGYDRMMQLAAPHPDRLLLESYPRKRVTKSPLHKISGPLSADGLRF